MIEITKNLSSEENMLKKIFLSMALSQIATSCCLMISSFIDGIFIGKFFGAEDIAAYGLISPMYLFITAISTTFALGASTYCGILLGKGNIQKAKEIFTTNAFSLIFIMTLFTFFVTFDADSFSEFMGAKGAHENLKESVIYYIYGFAIGFLPMTATLNLMSFLYLEGEKKRVIVSTVASLAVNIVGDALNVFVFNGGLFGIALSTSAGYFLSFFILAAHYRKNPILFFTLKNFSLKPVKEIVSAGFSNAIGRFSVFAKIFAINHFLMANFPQLALTAFSVRNNLDNVYLSAVLGMSAAILVLGSVYAGEEDKTSLRILYKISLKYCLIITLLISAVVFVFAEEIITFYLPSDPEEIPETVKALRLYIISFPLSAIPAVYLSFARMFRKNFLSNSICIFRGCLFVIFFVVLLGSYFGLDGVWSAFIFAEIASILYVFIAICKHCGHFPRNIDEWMMLPKNFDESPKDRLRLTVTNMDEVLKASENVQKFLSEQGLNKRDAYIMALIVEEMGGNIIRWSFTKKNTISIYLVFKNNEWTLRLRDDCTPFNPKKWWEMSLQNEDEPFKNMGIRLIMSVAKNIEYINVLRINNLIIKIPQNQ